MEVRPPEALEILIPECLQEQAIPVYKKCAQDLKDLGLFTNHDAIALACFCNSLMIYLELQEDLQQNGLMVMTKKGRRPNPALKACNTAYNELCKGFSQFGMSPADRAGLIHTVQEIKQNAEETKASLFNLPGPG